MNRRAFIAGIGAVLAAPLAVRAQAPTNIPHVGIVWIAPFSDARRSHEAFLSGLRDVGYVEGRSIVVDVRTADGNTAQLAGLVAELLRSHVDVIVAPSTEAAKAAKAATSSVPIVMANVTAPESTGLVASLSRPGGNVTGLSNVSADLTGKYLEEEKFVGRTVHEGKLTSLCEVAAEMESEPTPVTLSNLQITVVATLLGNPPGEIYAKAVESIAGTPRRMKIRFSSVTPELKSWMLNAGIR